jgi:BirA family biotin operon repressor/biotin-[acetyl-CoA-carboxylase] ligase
VLTTTVFFTTLYLSTKSNQSLLPSTAKNSIGEPFIELQQVESTNSYAIDKIQANLAAHGLAVFAYEQTAGRGQRGKEWHTIPGNNIILSAIVDTSFLLLHQQFLLSASTALACYDFFNLYANGDTNIKWPNDIYWRDRKAAGILIENSVRGNNWPFSVIGIGMNINQTIFPSSAKNPVSLKQITGKHFDAVLMAKELCSFLEKRYQQLKQGNEAGIFENYHEHLYKHRQKVRLKKDNIVFDCLIDGVRPDGKLLVKDCAFENFGFGEVEWIFEK